MATKVEPNSKDAINSFVTATGPLTLDQMMRDGLITSMDVAKGNEHENKSIASGNSKQVSGWTALWESAVAKRNDNLRYLLTGMSPPVVDLNHEFCTTEYSEGPCDSGSFYDKHHKMSSLHAAVHHLNFDGVKILIDFGANRLHENHQGKSAENVTYIGYHASDKDKSMNHLINTYRPTHEEMLAAQIESKIKIDAIFNDKNMSRFMQSEIDLKFDAIWEKLYPNLRSAIESGDLNLVKRSIPQCKVSVFLIFYLVSEIVVERDFLHLLELFGFDLHVSNANVDVRVGAGHTTFNLLLLNTEDNVFAGKLIKKLLLIGLDPTPATKTKIAQESAVFQCVSNSLVMCLIRIFNHKFFYVETGDLLELVETLLFEGLYSLV